MAVHYNYFFICREASRWWFWSVNIFHNFLILLVIGPLSGCACFGRRINKWRDFVFKLKTFLQNILRRHFLDADGAFLKSSSYKLLSVKFKDGKYKFILSLEKLNLENELAVSQIGYHIDRENLWRKRRNEPGRYSTEQRWAEDSPWKWSWQQTS